MAERLKSVAAITVLVILVMVPALSAHAETGKGKLPGPDSVDIPDLDKDPGLYFLMAEQAAARGDHQAVLRYYRKALSLDPTSAYLNTRIATLMARKRKMANALIMARMAALFDPKYEEAHSLLCGIGLQVLWEGWNLLKQAKSGFHRCRPGLELFSRILIGHDHPGCLWPENIGQSRCLADLRVRVHHRRRQGLLLLEAILACPCCLNLGPH